MVFKDNILNAVEENLDGKDPDTQRILQTKSSPLSYSRGQCGPAAAHKGIRPNQRNGTQVQESSAAVGDPRPVL